MAVFGFLLFNLIVLHIYLLVNGLTTYQFLQKRRKEQIEEKKRQDVKDGKMEIIRTYSNNKVMPAQESINNNNNNTTNIAVTVESKKISVSSG